MNLHSFFRVRVSGLCLAAMVLMAAGYAMAQDNGQPKTSGQIEALIRQGDNAAMNELAAILNNGTVMERYYVAQGLGTIKGSAKSVDYLLAAYAKETSARVSSEILVSLGKQKDPRAIPVLTEALKDYGKRNPAAKGLLHSGDRSALPYFRSIMNSEDPGDRAFAIECLGKFKAEDLNTILISRLETEAEPSVFSEICTQIDENKITDAIPALLNIGVNPRQNGLNRVSAIQVLGNLKAEQAQKSIEQALTDSDPNVRVAAAFALERIQPTAPVKPVGPMQADPKRENYLTGMNWTAVPGAAGYLVTVCSAEPTLREGRMIPNGILRKSRFSKNPRLTVETGDGDYYLAVEAVVPDAIKRSPLIIGRSAGLVSGQTVKHIQVGLTPSMRAAVEAGNSVPVQPPRAAAIQMDATENVDTISSIIASPEANMGKVFVVRATKRQIAPPMVKCPFSIMYGNDHWITDDTGSIPVVGAGQVIAKDATVVGQVQKLHSGKYVFVAIAMYED